MQSATLFLSFTIIDSTKPECLNPMSQHPPTVCIPAPSKLQVKEVIDEGKKEKQRCRNRQEREGERERKRVRVCVRGRGRGREREASVTKRKCGRRERESEREEEKQERFRRILIPIGSRIECRSLERTREISFHGFTEPRRGDHHG